MQLTTLLLAGVAAVGVSASPSWVPDQVTVKEEYKVPGDNPLYFCNDPADYILTIDKVDLDPNPPKPYVCNLSWWQWLCERVQRMDEIALR
jgi:hypothetical protein